MSVEAWVIVRRYDNEEPCESTSELETSVNELPPQSLELSQNLSFGDLKSSIKSSIGLAEDGKEVIKLRRADGTLLTLSYLLEGNTKENAYFLDIFRVNQHNTVLERSALPPSYANTVRSKLATLEKRVEQVEALLPDLQTRRQADVEQILHQLGSKVHFLDKRLDELMPLDWRRQFELAPV